MTHFLKTKLTDYLTCLLAALALHCGANAQAAMIITYAEAPNDTTSTLNNTDLFTFNAMRTGVNTNVNWAGVGTFNQLFVKNADAYGGAADAGGNTGTRYSLQGAGTSVLTSTLTLNTDSSYFGMWWSAGDPKNVLQFYNGSSLVGQFTTANLMAPLPSEYDGNPLNRNINRFEPYAFINFFGDTDTSWDRIVFSNNGSSGFESDNYTTRVAAWDPLVDGALPGVPVAMVSGATTTSVTTESLKGTTWAAAPAAPLPGLPLMLLFGVAALLRGGKFSDVWAQATTAK